MASADQIVSLAAGVPVSLSGPFNSESQAAAYTASASTTLYGVDKQGPNNDLQVTEESKTGLVILDVEVGTQAGTDVTFASADFPGLVDAHVDSGTLAVADNLRVVCRTIGQNGRVINTLTRVAASANPGAGEFKTSGTTGTAVTLTLGEVDLATDALGYSLEVSISAAADITSQALTQNLPTEVITRTFMVANNAARLERI